MSRTTTMVAVTDSSDRAGSVETVPFDSMSNTVRDSAVCWSRSTEQVHLDKRSSLDSLVDLRFNPEGN